MALTLYTAPSMAPSSGSFTGSSPRSAHDPSRVVSMRVSLSASHAAAHITDTALLDQVDPRRQVTGLQHVLLHEQHADAALVDLVYGREDLLHQIGVRLSDGSSMSMNRASPMSPRPIASRTAGERPGHLALAFLEPREQAIVQARSSPAPWPAPLRVGCETQVVAHAHVEEEMALLGHVQQTGFDDRLDRFAGDVVALEADAATGAAHQAGGCSSSVLLP